MEDEEIKEKKKGVSVRELENFGKRYFFEIAFLLYFVLASFFSSFFFGLRWSLYLAAIGGILGVFFSKKMEAFGRKVFHLVYKQEKITRWVMAAVGLIISIVLPPITFLFLGLMGGSLIYHLGSDASTEEMHSSLHDIEGHED